MNLEKVVFGFFVVLAATLNFGFFIGDISRPELHNQRLLKRHLGKTPAEALERFRAVINSTVVPSGDTPAWLG